jgi:hypothetical protein
MVTHNPPLGISATDGDVDRARDPLEAALWMDRVATYPGFAQAKARALVSWSSPPMPSARAGRSRVVNTPVRGVGDGRRSR